MKTVWLVLLGAVLATGATGQTTEDRKAVLKFGIESEVLDLVRALRQEKNDNYRDDLLVVYDRARNDDLKESLILFFLDLKDQALESRVLKELGNPKGKGNSLLLNCVSYLTEIKSQAFETTLVGLLDDKDTLSGNQKKVLDLAAIRALGKLGATGRADKLIGLYRDAETDPNYKPDLIWALGEMKARDAVEVLLKDYDDNESQPLLRKSILEAVGKIGDDRAWSHIEDALADTNTDIRSAAVAALGSFPGKGDRIAFLTSALRDSQVAVRVAGAQAAQKAPANELKELLQYRVKKDPDAKVRVACLQALAAYGDGPSLVLAYVADAKTEITVWREALNLALDKSYPGTLDALKKALEADAKDKNGNLTALIGGAILPKRDTYRSLYGLLLASDKAPARSIALRGIGLGKYTEFEGVLKTLADRDPDVGVKAQAAAILKDWAPKKE